MKPGGSRHTSSGGRTGRRNLSGASIRTSRKCTQYTPQNWRQSIHPGQCGNADTWTGRGWSLTRFDKEPDRSRHQCLGTELVGRTLARKGQTQWLPCCQIFFFFFSSSITHTHLFGLMRPWSGDLCPKDRPRGRPSCCQIANQQSGQFFLFLVFLHQLRMPTSSVWCTHGPETFTLGTDLGTDLEGGQNLDSGKAWFREISPTIDNSNQSPEGEVSGSAHRVS